MPQLAAKNCNITEFLLSSQAPKHCQSRLSLRLCLQNIALLIAPEQHIQENRNQCKGRYCADDVAVSGEEHPKLIDDQRKRIRKAALVADCKPSPFCAVHLPPDCADCGEAGRAQQVEDQEGVGREGCKRGAYILPHLPAVFRNLFKPAEEHAEGANHILLCDQARDGSHRSLPGAPAERCENPSDRIADDG